jgi:hypothetical protein
MNSLNLFFSSCFICLGLQAPLHAMEEGVEAYRTTRVNNILRITPQIFSSDTLSQMEQAINSKVIRNYNRVLQWTEKILFIQNNQSLLNKENLEEFQTWQVSYKPKVSIKALWKLILFAVEHNHIDEAIFWHKIGLQETDYFHSLHILDFVKDFFLTFISRASLEQLYAVINLFPSEHPLHDEIARQIRETEESLANEYQACLCEGDAAAIKAQITSASKNRDVESLLKLSELHPTYQDQIQSAIEELLSQQDMKRNQFVTSISDHPVAAAAALATIGAGAIALTRFLHRR